MSCTETSLYRYFTIHNIPNAPSLFKLHSFKNRFAVLIPPQLRFDESFTSIFHLVTLGPQERELSSTSPEIFAGGNSDSLPPSAWIHFSRRDSDGWLEAFRRERFRGKVKEFH